MLLRVYRLSDKFALLFLKLSSAASDWLLEGLSVIVGTTAWGAGRTGQGIVGIIGGLFGAIIWLLKQIVSVIIFIVTVVFRILRTIATIIYRILQFIATQILAIATLILGLLQRVLGGAAKVGVSSARRAATSAASASRSAMAERKADADVDVVLIEDPLKAQNRTLSVLFVALGVIVVAVILWATDPSRTTPTVVAGAVDNQPIGLVETPLATPEAVAAIGNVATPIPTATQVPAALQAGGTLAFTVLENGQTDIWAVGVGESDPIRLTNNVADERSPAWSPSDAGRQLAYTSRQDGNWEIYVYNLDSQTTERITFDLSFQGNPDWSPDGAWLTYESYQGDNLDIYAVPVDGSASPVRFTDHPAPDFSPAWSPSGRQVAFVSWRDNNQEIYIFDLDTLESTNITNTPSLNEENPKWNVDGSQLAYSAVEQGIEKVFVKSITDSNPPTVISRGRTPAWSPDGFGLAYISDASTQDVSYLYAEPFGSPELPTEVISVPYQATDLTWTNQSLPPALVNAGGLELLADDPLYVEQEVEYDSEPRYRLDTVLDVQVRNAVLNDRVNDSFNALRLRVLEESGVDFLSELDDAFWEITRLPQPGEERRNWHLTGRAFAITRNEILGFPPRIELVREEDEIGQVKWRVFLRVTEDAQSGQLGEPLRTMPWDMLSRNQGDVEAYNQGGRLRGEVPTGYYIDLTALAAQYGWYPLPAGSDWRANSNSINYWIFVKTDNIDWYTAMREIYAESQLGGFVPTPTPLPSQVQQEES